VPTDTDTLASFPLGNVGARFIDDARHSMSWNAGILNSGPQPFFREHITVADAAGLHFDPHVSNTRLGNFPLDDPEICSGT
jgi:hypothetical protein